MNNNEVYVRMIVICFCQTVLVFGCHVDVKVVCGNTVFIFVAVGQCGSCIR